MNALPQIIAGMRHQDNENERWHAMILASSHTLAWTAWGIPFDDDRHFTPALSVKSDLGE